MDDMMLALEDPLKFTGSGTLMDKLKEFGALANFKVNRSWGC